MRKCVKCEHEYADEFAFCPHCGEACVDDLHEMEQISEAALANSCATAKAKKGKAAKLAQFEAKYHYIQNTIVLVMSLILLLCSFLAGAKLKIANDNGFYSVPQNIIQIIEGEVAVIGNGILNEGDELTIGYLEAWEKGFADTIADYGGYDRLPDLDSYNAYMAFNEKVGKNMGRTGFNFCRYITYNTKYVLTVSHDSYYRTSSINYACGMAVSLALIITQICLAVTTFVYAIKALIALLRRKAIADPFKTAALPFAFIMARFVTIVIHPSMLIDGAGITLVIIGALFMLALGIHKFLFTDSSTSCSVMSLSKKATLFALVCIAYFVACGPIYNIVGADTSFGNGVSYPVSGNSVLFDGALSYYSYLDSANGEQFLTPFLISLLICAFYLVLMSIGAKMTVSAFKYVTDLENAKKDPLKRTKAYAIALIVFLVIIIASTIFLGSVLPDNSNNHVVGTVIFPKPSVSANMIISLVICVALLIADKAWKIPLKQSINQ